MLFSRAVGNNMKKRPSRRIAPSSAYIGAGNRTSSFTHKPRRAFGVVAQLYRDELPQRSSQDYRGVFKTLSGADKKKIRMRILEKKRKQDTIKIMIAILLLAMITVAGILILK